MWVLGTLNAIPFDKQIYIYLPCLQVQKLSEVKFEVWSPKSEV